MMGDTFKSFVDFFFLVSWFWLGSLNLVANLFFISLLRCAIRAYLHSMHSIASDVLTW